MSALRKKDMKNILILLTVLLLPLTADGQDKPSFSAREMADVRVATPGLFAKSNHIYLHLDSLKDHEYAFPLPGGKVISAYGTRGGHSGTDIKTCAKDTIRAAFDGVVRMSKPYYAYGNIVVIRHANGLETLYSHNFKNLVKSGDIVKAGQPIALTGRTGRATPSKAARNPYQRRALQSESDFQPERENIAERMYQVYQERE